MKDAFPCWEVVPVGNLPVGVEDLQPIFRCAGKARRDFDHTGSANLGVTQPNIKLFRRDHDTAVEEIIKPGVRRQGCLANDAPLTPMKQVGAFGFCPVLKGADVMERDPNSLRQEPLAVRSLNHATMNLFHWQGASCSVMPAAHRDGELRIGQGVVRFQNRAGIGRGREFQQRQAGGKRGIRLEGVDLFPRNQHPARDGQRKAFIFKLFQQS